MNKKYSYTSIGLLIALLNFHIFSSCVNVRQVLDGAILVGGIIQQGLDQLSNWYANTMPNISSALSSNITPTQENFIIKAIQNHPTDLIPNRITKRSIFGLWAKRYSGDVKDPMVIDNAISQDMGEKILQDFSGKNRLRAMRGYSYQSNQNDLIVSNRHWLSRMKHWLTKGLNIEARSENGHSLLEQAIITQNEEAIHFILNQGADVNAKNKDGETAIFFAVRRMLDEVYNGRMGPEDDIFDLLIKHKADLCTKNNKGQTIQAIAESHYKTDNNYVVKAIRDRISSKKQCPAP